MTCVMRLMLALLTMNKHSIKLLLPHDRCRNDQTQMSLGRKAANIVASFTLICCVKQILCLTWPVLCIGHSRVALPC